MPRLSTPFLKIIIVTPKAMQYKLRGRERTRLSVASRWHRHSQRPGQGNQEKRLLFYFFFFFLLCSSFDNFFLGAGELRAAKHLMGEFTKYIYKY